MSYLTTQVQPQARVLSMLLCAVVMHGCLVCLVKRTVMTWQARACNHLARVPVARPLKTLRYDTKERSEAMRFLILVIKCVNATHRPLYCGAMGLFVPKAERCVAFCVAML